MKSLRFMYILATSGVSQTFNESCIFPSVRRLSLYTRATLCQHSKPSSCLCSNTILDYTHTHTRTFWNNCFTLAVLLKYSKHVLRNNFRRNTFFWMHRGSQWCWAASLRCGAGVKPSAVRSFRPIMCLCVCFLKVVYFILNLNPWNVLLRTPLLHILVFGQQLTSIIKCSLKIVNCALTHSFFFGRRLLNWCFAPEINRLCSSPLCILQLLSFPSFPSSCF